MHKLGIYAHIILEAIKSTNEGISISDAQLPDYPLIYVNHGFEKMTGYDSKDVIGKNCRFLQKHETNQPNIKTLREALANSINCRVLLKNYKKDGSMFWNELNISPIKNDKDTVTHYVGIQKDVTLQEESRKKIEQFSLHDELTGLLNRHGLYTEANNFYAWDNRNKQNVVVIMLDLNNFKTLNDTKGHQAGDSVLATYASALRKNFRKNDLLSRFGGDEFVILTAMDSSINELEITKKIEKIIKATKIDRQYSDMISVSFGLQCSCGKSAEDLDELIKEADKKMYEMKRQFHYK